MAGALQFQGKYHVPSGSGSYVVGSTDIMTAQGLKGTFARLYYPTALKDIFEHASMWAPWIPHPRYLEGWCHVTGIHPFIGKRLMSWAFGSHYTPIVMNAVPYHGRQFPIIVFSHGLTACRTSYSVFCTDIASHGFIVAALEHRDGSACLSYSLTPKENGEEPETEWIFYKAMKLGKDDFHLRQEQLPIRVEECTRMLDLLRDLNEGKCVENLILPSVDLSHFKDCINLSFPIIAGHSFGGTTVLRTLAVEKRFKLGILLDGWMWPIKDEVNLPTQIDVPLLFINMEAFQTKSNLRVIQWFANCNSSERKIITLKGSVHQNQVDTPFILPSYLRRFAGAHSIIDPHLAMNLNNRITLLFIWKHLGHDLHEEYKNYVDLQNEWIYEGIQDS